MNRIKYITLLSKITVFTIVSSTIAIQAQAIAAASGRSTSAVVPLSQNNLDQGYLAQTQNGTEGSGLEPPVPSQAPLETVPSSPDAGITLPSPLEPSPVEPSPDEGSGEIPQPTPPSPTLDDGVVPDNPPEPIQPLNNLPNNNVPDPRQNVPNPSVNTAPN